MGSVRLDLINRLKAFTHECGTIMDASIRLGVRPSTIERLLAGKQVSHPTTTKIEALLKIGGIPNALPDHNKTTTDRLRLAHKLYTELGTLEAVGRVLGVTRERVRQLLVKGTRLGIFEYRPFDYPYISKEKIISDYTRFQNFNRVATTNNVSIGYLQKVMTAYSITEEDLAAYRREGKRTKCLEQYDLLVRELGHHPTTTELQSTSRGHALHSRITRLWGSIDAFREYLNVPRPPQGSKTFREDTGPWREQQQQIALITRMQHLDLIRECLSNSGPLKSLDISGRCNLSPQRTLELLRLLIAAGEVQRVGASADTKYILTMIWR